MGMEIERDGELGQITLGQTQYIQELLRKHCITECRLAATPLDTGYQVACDGQCTKVDGTAYQSVIGELMTRSDILHSAAKLAQRNKDPHSEHMAGVKHVLRYLSATVNYKLR